MHVKEYFYYTTNFNVFIAVHKLTETVRSTHFTHTKFVVQ